MRFNKMKNVCTLCRQPRCSFSIDSVNVVLVLVRFHHLFNALSRCGHKWLRSSHMAITRNGSQFEINAAMHRVTAIIACSINLLELACDGSVLRRQWRMIWNSIELMQFFRAPLVVCSVRRARNTPWRVEWIRNEDKEKNTQQSKSAHRHQCRTRARQAASK